MTQQLPPIQPYAGPSVCLFCGSSPGADPAFMDAAREFGAVSAQRGWRLVYGGGGVGLMGASAQACHEAGGRVLGIMPQFLRSHERLYDEVETVIVTSMHERKMLMYDQSDAFVVAPGGIGTLEEVIEVLSWKRLDLHRKPVIFLNINGYWDSLVSALGDGVRLGLTPTSFQSAFQVCPDVRSTFEALDTTPG